MHVPLLQPGNLSSYFPPALPVVRTMKIFDAVSQKRTDSISTAETSQVKSMTLIFVFVGQQGPEFNGYLVGRGNAREIDLNRNFPDLNALMYYYEKNNGRNHHLPLPDNWEQQVSVRHTQGHVFCFFLGPLRPCYTLPLLPNMKCMSFVLHV